MGPVRDLGHNVDTKYLTVGQTATGGSTGDGTPVDCTEVDIRGYSSGKIVIAYEGVLNAAETLAFAVDHAEGDVTLTYGADAVVQANTVAVTSAGATDVGVVEIDVDLSGWKQFQQIEVTPSLSSNGTLKWSAVMGLFGKNYHA